MSVTLLTHSKRRYSTHVGNLPMDIREQDLEDLFQKYGRIRSVDLKTPARYVRGCMVDGRFRGERVCVGIRVAIGCATQKQSPAIPLSFSQTHAHHTRLQPPGVRIRGV